MIVGCLALVFAATGCGDKSGDEGTWAESARVPAAAEDAAYDGKYFSMTVASGWVSEPQNGGRVIFLPKDGWIPKIGFDFEDMGDGPGTAEEAVKAIIARFDGSPMESTEIGGVEFKTTTYKFAGSTLTTHIAFRKGTKINITIEDDDAEDPDIRAMLGSVAFK